jgi:hypothetical protein
VPTQVVEPAVSRGKFEREIAEYRKLEQEYRARGWFLIEAEFPVAFVVMAARQLPVPAMVTGVRLDYTNYDFEPPSVQLVNPFNGIPYVAKDLPVRLDRQAAAPQGVQIQIGGQSVPILAVQPYLQWYSPDDVPFLCLPGVREYHQHPGHSGDRWELHRAAGAGRLVRLLDVIYRYGVVPIDSLAIQLQFVPQIQGFHSNPPE